VFEALNGLERGALMVDLALAAKMYELLYLSIFKN